MIPGLDDKTDDLPRAAPPQARGDRPRGIGDVWQWLGMGGDAIGTSGILRRTLAYGVLTAAAVGGAINAMNVISMTRAMPASDWLRPVIWEGSSWLTLMAFFWIPWLAYRIGPPPGRPRWRLLVHLPALLAFAAAHIGGFLLLRRWAYRLLGDSYLPAFQDQFAYELRKDVLAYVLFIAGFWLIERLLRQQQLIASPGQELTFDIKDGGRLTRVRLSQILAIGAAGNYVEFGLEDGRKLLMRSSLGGVESDLSARGFVRTHRSWLVNAAQVTELAPDGSGDYTVTLRDMKVPLSRRYPEALARLRGARS